MQRISHGFTANGVAIIRPFFIRGDFTMTVEKAVFYIRMLAVGMNDAYLRDLDKALGSDKQLSDIVVELSFYPSNINKTISILNEYIIGKEQDENIVYQLIKSELKDAMLNGKVSARQAANAMIDIMLKFNLYLEGPWEELSFLMINYEDEIQDRVYSKFFVDSFTDFLLS